jgi:hypothetical protein
MPVALGDCSVGLRGCRRILRALADGETDPVRLADLGNWRLRASKEELRDARKRWKRLTAMQIS